MAAPTVSILMPVRDAQATVEAAVQSIQAQSHTDWELVVINDGSQDDTSQVLDRLALADPRIVVRHLPHQGIALALQAGTAICQGRYLARMDADDVMHPHRLAQQQTFLDAHPHIGLVSCRVRFGGTETGYAAHVNWLNTLLTPEALNLRRFVEAPVAHPSVMFRRDLLLQYGGYRSGDFPEDYELWLRWQEAGVALGKVDAELLTWNDPPTRLSRRDSRYSVEAFYRMKQGYLATWLRQNVAPGRALWLWGAGRITRRRFAPLAALGVQISGFIDVDPAKRGSYLDGLPVRLADDLPHQNQAFIVSGVAARGAREQITHHLEQRGWREGRDFILAA